MVNYFDFKKEYILESEMVKLYPFHLQHIEKLKGISDDHDVWKYFINKGNGHEQLKKYGLSAIQQRSKGLEYPFAIYDKRKNSYAGMTHLYEYNNELRIVKMGHTWLGKQFWGTNLNKHCKFLLFNFIFEDLNLERVGFGVHGQNYRSIFALKSIGCEQEGKLRNFLPSLTDSNRIDLLLFSLIKRDWTTKVKEELKNKLN